MKNVFGLVLSTALICICSDSFAQNFGLALQGNYNVIAKNSTQSDWYEAIGGGAGFVLKKSSYNYGVFFNYSKAESSLNSASELSITFINAEPFFQYLVNSSSKIPLLVEFRAPVGRANSTELGSRYVYGGGAGLGIEFKLSAKIHLQLSAIGYYLLDSGSSSTYRAMNHDLRAIIYF